MRIKLGNRKLLFILALLAVSSMMVILSRSTFFLCHNQPVSSYVRFKEYLNQNLGPGRGAWKSVQSSARGYWTGEKLSEYHHFHYGAKLTQRLVSFFKAENASSIVDLGGGAGLHVKKFLRQGLFASCYDGAPNSQDISGGICSSMDLTKPMKLAKYDWVLSLSVGRQIPTFFETQFLTNIHNLNKRGVVIYWGDGRVVEKPKNPKNNTQVIKIFEEMGYENDEIAAKFLYGPHPTDVNYTIRVFRRGNANVDYVDSVKLKNSTSEPDIILTSPYGDVKDDTETINIALTACGLDQMEQALTLVKSAILFSQHAKLRAFVFVDSDTIHVYEEKMRVLKNESRGVNSNFNYVILPTQFPTEMDGMAAWKEIFKPCSLQRLFLPSLLPSIDALIYLDADSIILSNLTQFWAHFYSMQPSNFIGVTEITEFSVKSWFQKNNLPHYGKRGVNTGISLMNLTRMRDAGFLKLIIKVRKHYEHLRPNESGDQFLQNVLYSFYPEFVYIIPCKWNLRPIHCRCEKKQKCFCKSALDNGAAVLHGTSDAFTDPDRLPFFRNIYSAFNTFNFTTNTITSLLEKLEYEYGTENQTCFFKNASSFYKRMETYATNLRG